MDKSERNKFWIAILTIFTFGALTSNAAWLYYTNVKDVRFEKRVTQIEGSYKYQMGQQRTMIEKKIDAVLNRLDKMPQTPVVIDVKRVIEEAKHE